MQIKLVIPGKPIAKARPRFFRRGKFVGTYNSQDTEEGKFMLEAKSQLDGYQLIDGPISLEIIFALPRLKSHYGTGRNAGKLKKSAPIYHTKKADIDNYCKFAMDCLNNVAWKDDSQVVALTAEKMYADEARTIIFIQPLATGG
jgi:Holliday junction resolvase RusA-like endonuclease